MTPTISSGEVPSIGRERDARHAHALGESLAAEERARAAEELHRLALELELPVLVGLEHRPRAGAERAVVEEDDVLAEEEVPGEIVGHQRPFRVGSRASRRPSPNSVVASTVMARAAVGNTAMCQ